MLKKYKNILLSTGLVLGLLSHHLEDNLLSVSAAEISEPGEEVVVPEEPIIISKEEAKTYHIVRANETVYSIANRYGISEAELTGWNNISDNVILVNQVLSIDGVNKYATLVKESNTFNSTQQFINRVAPVALEMAKKYQLYPSVMIAQATLETGSGTSELAVLANNYFGIKGTYQGHSVYKMSPEEIKGNIINQSSRFRVYPNLKASFDDNGKRLREGPATDSEGKSWNQAHYQATWIENAYTYRNATQALVDAGYATDSRYAVKLNQIIETHQLTKYDKQLYPFIEERERTLVKSFTDGVNALPSVANIKKMSKDDLKTLEKEMNQIRQIYVAISATDQKKADVVKWEGYLTTKQKAVQESLEVELIVPTPESKEEGTANDFVSAAKALPSVSAIEKMTSGEITALDTEMKAVRTLYAGLSTTDRTNSAVIKWAGYLVSKEEALEKRLKSNNVTVSSSQFLTVAQKLPSVSAIEKMTKSQLEQLTNGFATVRSMYNQLSTTKKQEAEVVKWEGYLKAKETAAKTVDGTVTVDQFLRSARDLPSIAAIQKMTANQLTKIQTDLSYSRAQYDSLSSSDKKLGPVKTWEGYLKAKEDAVAEKMGVRLSTAVRYGVESGDTFNSIAEKFKVDVKDIVKHNPKLNPSNLKSGDTVIVPNALARPMDKPEAMDRKNVVYLDAGHGGTDPGAIHHGVREKDLNLILANKLTDQLTKMGYEVVNVRTNDRSVSLTDRAKEANASNADIYISLHHNAFNGSVSGIESFYYKYAKGANSSVNRTYHNDGARIASSVYLASLVQDNLVKATGANNRGVKERSLAVIRETAIPATLIEFGFMDNKQELSNLTNNAYTDKMTNAVATAIDQYFKTFY